MAPRTRAKKPAAEQTYTSKPALVQQRFPNRRTKKAYASARRLLETRQSTLTQIDFGRLSGRDKIADSEEDEFEEEEPPRKRRKSSGRAGDEEKNNSRRKAAYTQTLTQMDFVRSRMVEDSEEEGLLSDEEELTPHPGTNHLDPQSEVIEDTEAIASPGIEGRTEVPDSIGTTESKEGSIEQNSVHRDEPSNILERIMPPPRAPQTPKRVRILAVPSSQTPPTTPLSTQRSHSRSGSVKDRSPLQERSTNVLISQERNQDIPESEKPNSPFQALVPTTKDTGPVESPTRQRARDFRAAMDKLRNGGALQQPRRKTGPFKPNQVIRSSTAVSLASEEGEIEVRNTRPKTGETQFAIGEETQAILGGIDLACEVVQEPEAVEGEEEQEQEKSITGRDGDENAEEDDDPIFDIGEPEEPLEDESAEIPDLTDVPEPDAVYSQDIRPRRSSPKLLLDDYEAEERVPSSQNETPRGTRRIHHEPTTQGRRVTFSDQLMLPMTRSPASTGPVGESLDTQESIDAASAQLLYESQAYAALAASSPIQHQQIPISSPIHAPLSSQNHSFRTPRIPRKTAQVPPEEETVAPSTGRTESLSTTSGTYPRSTMKPTRILSSPPPPQQQTRSSPTTPGIFRFLRGPITVSQLIPDSLRSDADDGIGLPPRWTQEDDEDDDEL